MSALDYEATERHLRDGVVGRTRPIAAVVVAGPDARSYLQGQVSQDLDPLGVGGAVESLLLSPQGKLDAYVRVGARATEEFVVLVDADFGEATYERLRRFKLRVKATLDLRSWRVAELRGPGSAALVPPGLSADGLAIAVDWPGLLGVDLVGPDAELPAGVPTGDEAAFEVARIEAGWPVMGRELTERTIAAEAGLLNRAVSFTKGCYTGQELVARLDARGNNVVHRLRRFSVAGPEAGTPEVGAPLFVAEREVGVTTSVAYSPTRQAAVGLAYLRREVVPPCDLRLGDDLARAVQVRELPGGEDATTDR